MTAILRLQLDDKDPVRVNSAINQLAEYSDRNQRSKLTTNTTFYVSTSGSNSNSGSQTSPFLTIQHAYDVITNTMDLGGQSITIQCATGTYTTGISLIQPWTGGGNVVLDLNGGIISTSGDCISVFGNIPNPFFIQNGTLISSGANCINHGGTGTVGVGSSVTFGSAASGSHMTCAGSGAKIGCNNPYAITGGAVFHMLAVGPGNGIVINNNITITGTPAFNTFARATRLSFIDSQGRTYSGGSTGTRYFVDTNAVIYTGGGGANYFPGTIAGSTDGFGVYV